jgi:chromosomal replication initiation ATPase DnaA
MPFPRAAHSATPPRAPECLQGSAALYDQILCGVAEEFAVALADLMAPTRRTRNTALARQSAMYLAHVTGALSFAAIGSKFARDRTTVAHACRCIEDRRDDPAFDRRLARLEHRIMAAGAVVGSPAPGDREGAR